MTTYKIGAVFSIRDMVDAYFREMPEGTRISFSQKRTVTAGSYIVSTAYYVKHYKDYFLLDSGSDFLQRLNDHGENFIYPDEIYEVLVANDYDKGAISAVTFKVQYLPTEAK